MHVHSRGVDRKFGTPCAQVGNITLNAMGDIFKHVKAGKCMLSIEE